MPFLTKTKPIDRGRRHPFTPADICAAFGWSRETYDIARALGLETIQRVRTVDDDGHPLRGASVERVVHATPLVTWLERLQALGVTTINGHAISDLLGK